jgi:hypothetical protein
MKTFAACLTFAVISYASLAHAQCFNGNCRPASQSYASYGVPQNHYGFGGPVAGHVHHASTAYESAMRGMAARAQAQAQYNLMTSLAAMNMAQVKQMEMENKRLKAENFAAQREAYKQRVAAHWAERRSGRKQPTQAGPREDGQFFGGQPQPANLAWNN